MRYSIWAVIVILLSACTPRVNDLADQLPVQVDIDLVTIDQDRVNVTVDPGRFTSDTVTFMIPKTVPGTYSINNYGQFIDNFSAVNYKGDQMTVIRKDVNTFVIPSGKELDKVSYLVNDSFDTESQVEDAVFSPAGTNIEANENFFLNMHMLVGYFKGFDRRPYDLRFKRPDNFRATTSLTEIKTTDNNTDHFYADRYFEVTDNPVMYTNPDVATFMVNDIEIVLSVYSPSKVYSAASLKPEIEAMMQAQKDYLGDLDATKQYNILLFLSTLEDNAPRGFGALEHHTSTTVVLPESMPKPMLVETMIDVVSHEFFHIVTPLSIHSEEIHYFNYNDPLMSQHLWMYEGVTEYFAQHFQIYQDLISEEEFYNRTYNKIQNSQRYNDSLSFTEMSANILADPYKDNYANVYEKGSLIGMCIDLIIREQSQGEKGILWLMKSLATRYGKDNPFKDDALFSVIGELTYPEVEQFIADHIQGDTPIPYEDYLAKAGLTMTNTQVQTPTYFFKNEQEPFIDATEDGDIYVRYIPLSTFYTSLGLAQGDIIKQVNGTAYTLDNAQALIMASVQWQPGDEVEFVVERDEETLTLSGAVTPGVMEVQKIIPVESPTPEQLELKNAWLGKTGN